VKIIGSFIAALVLFGSSTFARIGETEVQIEKRYGKPTSRSAWTKGYLHEGLFIIVTFDDRISAIETYQKRNGAPMTAGEICRLLEANGDGSEWEKSAGSDFEISYAAKTRFAEYNAITSTLTIADYGALNRIDPRSPPKRAHVGFGLTCVRSIFK